METVTSDGVSEEGGDGYNFHKADVVGEGPKSLVLKAIDLKSGNYLALKMFKVPVTKQEVKLFLDPMKEMVNKCKRVVSGKRYFI